MYAGHARRSSRPPRSSRLRDRDLRFIRSCASRCPGKRYFAAPVGRRQYRHQRMHGLGDTLHRPAGVQAGNARGLRPHADRHFAGLRNLGYWGWRVDLATGPQAVIALRGGAGGRIGRHDPPLCRAIRLLGAGERHMEHVAGNPVDRG